ncbi:MAG TPA: ABC transporter substrate-binding protein, partial [Clostridia bacterium]|nr:ABC transporter substrate-binding protein [Clostridia bacterium]
EARYAAALQAAIGYFKAAGYTWNDSTKKFTAAPEGASLKYEALIPGDGSGDHPNFQVLTNTSEALKKIGITLEVNDLADSSVLWERLDAGTQELWTAAWGSTIDPDMYQVYHSSGIVGKGGSDSNHYHIADSELDDLIVEARKSDDQTYRKSVYKACLDLIIDWAVEVPSYQRQNIIVFSTERGNIDTVTPDITTFWGWMNDIELLEVYEAN